jgi:hypothetical protein
MMLKVFPWTSCDCSSWLRTGGFGSIDMKNKRGNLARLDLTGAKGAGVGARREHLPNERMRDLLGKCKRYGITIEQMEAHYSYRQLFCLLEEAEAAQSINSLKTFQAQKVASFF